MAANCAQLRQSLAHLQSQLNVLTNNKEKEEPPKPEKPKKSKSKKNKDKSQKAAQETAQEVVEVQKEPESDESNAPKDNVEECKPNTSKHTVHNGVADSPEEKVDSKTLESIFQAINIANINLCDLELNGDDKVDANESNSNEDDKTNDNKSIEVPIEEVNIDLNDKSSIVEVNLTEETKKDDTPVIEAIPQEPGKVTELPLAAETV